MTAKGAIEATIGVQDAGAAVDVDGRSDVAAIAGERNFFSIRERLCDKRSAACIRWDRERLARQSVEF